ncbi:hypothetical protein FOZ61_000618, partial [Perkinsus olseni]
HPLRSVAVEYRLVTTATTCSRVTRLLQSDCNCTGEGGWGCVLPSLVEILYKIVPDLERLKAFYLLLKAIVEHLEPMEVADSSCYTSPVAGAQREIWLKLLGPGQ